MDIKILPQSVYQTSNATGAKKQESCGGSRQCECDDKRIMDGLKAIAAATCAMIHRSESAGMQSSAPSITNADDMVEREFERLNGLPVETIDSLKEAGYKPKINKDGLLVTLNVPYTGVLENNAGGLVEYEDGKPVTVVINEADGDHINKKLIKYEYPEGSIAALKTETSVINEYKHKDGHSLRVPTAIQKETGLDF